MNFTNFTVNLCKIQMLIYISAPRQNFKNLALTFLALIWKICTQNFNPLALKLREEFEVTDTHTQTDGLQ